MGWASRRLAVHPPRARWVPAHTPARGAWVAEVDRRLNGLADVSAEAAAAGARVPAAWCAQRGEALRHIRTVHDVFAVEVAALAGALFP